MGIKERRKRHKELLRRKILDAARDILLTRGYEQFSMRRLAEHIEYTPTTIYLHFKDKSDILFCLCEEIYGMVCDLLESAAVGIQDPAGRARAVIKAFVDFGLSDPGRYRIAFMMNIPVGKKTKGFLDAGTKGLQAYETLRKMVYETVKNKANDNEDIDCLIQVLWANTHGIIASLIEHPDFPWVDRDKLVNRSIEITVRGLGL
jgi:AcrR family transcriptional regulator